MILVTGAAGFIGSCLAEELGEGVILCDPRDESMLTPEEAIHYVKMQDNIEVVYHLGAISSTTETNMLALAQNNIEYSLRLLYLCLEKKIPFIYASSASVYGAATGEQREDQPLAPINGYAISKAAFDMFVEQIISLSPDAQIYGLRYFNVYGHREHHKKDMASPVHKFTMQARKTGKIKIFEGSDKYQRDFVHVDDVVKITIAASKFTKPGVYNVGTGEASSFAKVATLIANITDAEVEEIPFPDHLIGKYQTYTCSDNTKIAKVGYTNLRSDLRSGIKKTLALI